MTRLDGATSYGRLDRLLHRLAFGSPGVQLTLADLEDRVYLPRLKAVDIKCPVFIAALPRCGTTLLLEILCASELFASHTYADMPFMLCPLFWHSVTRRYRRISVPVERAHGDGMLVGYDSPESFEEVVWRALRPAQYRAQVLPVWERGVLDDAAGLFMRTHLKKIIALRSDGPRLRRYVSKNNANIARLELLGDLFPDCSIVIPFRSPEAHALSLHCQHQRFVEMQGRDHFARDYMEYLGHLEFGELFRPFAPGLRYATLEQSRAPDIAFWKAYWCGTYEYLLGHQSPRLLFFDLNALQQRPDDSLRALAEQLGARLMAPVADLSALVKTGAAQASVVGEGGTALSRDLYRRLRRRALNQL